MCLLTTWVSFVGQKVLDNVDTGLSWEMRIKSMCDNGSLVLVEDEMGGRNQSFIKAFDKVDV